MFKSLSHDKKTDSDLNSQAQSYLIEVRFQIKYAYNSEYGLALILTDNPLVLDMWTDWNLQLIEDFKSICL